MASARLELATSGLEDLRSKSIELRSRKIGEDERTRTFNLFIRSELLLNPLSYAPKMSAFDTDEIEKCEV